MLTLFKNNRRLPHRLFLILNLSDNVETFSSVSLSKSELA